MKHFSVSLRLPECQKIRIPSGSFLQVLTLRSFVPLTSMALNEVEVLFFLDRDCIDFLALSFQTWVRLYFILKQGVNFFLLAPLYKYIFVCSCFPVILALWDIDAVADWSVKNLIVF